MSDKNSWVIEQVKNTLPPSWKVGIKSSSQRGEDFIRFSAPDGKSTNVRLFLRTKMNPRTVFELLGRFGSPSEESIIVASDFISSSTIRGLRDGGFNYLDRTGNMFLSLESPALFVRSTGSSKNPCPPEMPLRSLKGTRLSRVVRALLDFSEPYGVTKLAELAGMDQGYVSRILDMLYQEAMFERSGRGPITKVYREKLIRRWAEDAPYKSRGKVGQFFKRGSLDGLVEFLKKTNLRYAATGNFAASMVRFIAPAAFAMLYVSDLDEAQDVLELNPVDEGSNVILIEPKDDFVFDRSTNKNGVNLAAFSQIAADLLTSPGRGPTIAEEFISWIKEEGILRE